MLEMINAPIQQQTLSPRMQQSLQILQMGIPELWEFVETLALENPLLEVETKFPVQPMESLGCKSGKERDDADEQGELYQRRSETLTEHLKLQMLDFTLSSREKCVLRTLIESVDESGYLRFSNDDLSTGLGVSAETIRKCRDLLQSMEPAGVGAEDLTDCLRLQLKRSYPDDGLSLFIVENMLDYLAKNQLPTIGRAAKAPIEKVRAAKARICSLNPKPGNSFETLSPVPLAIPDVFVQSSGGGLVLQINSKYLPRISLNEYYCALQTRVADDESGTYIRKKADQIQWVLACIQRRNKTLMDCVSVIVNSQQRYFLGEEQTRSPILQSEIATAIGVHPSTVSRALQGKYIHSRQGTEPLAAFLLRPVANSSRQSICVRLAEYIAKEDKAHPFTDQQLMELLRKDGISVARRTVTKYRESICLSAAARNAG